MQHPILPTKTSLEAMEVGDCILAEYVAPASRQVGAISINPDSTKELIPTSGSATPDGSFYFIKVAPTLLVSDRVVQTIIAWDTLNKSGYMEGCLPTLTNVAIGKTVIGGEIQNDSYPLSNATNGNTTDYALFYSISAGNQDNFTARERSMTVDLLEATAIDSVKVYTSYGCSSFDLEVSNDNKEFTLIGSYEVGLHGEIEIPVDLVEGYRYVSISNMLSSYTGSANIGLDEIEVYTSAFTSEVLIRSLTGGVAYTDIDIINVAQNQTYYSKNANFTLSNMFDNDVTTYGSLTVAPMPDEDETRIVVEFDSPKSIRYMSLVSAGRLNTKTFKLQYSDDNSTWTDAYEGSYPPSQDLVKYITGENGSHKYWGIVVTANYGGDNYKICFMEMCLGEEASIIPSTTDNGLGAYPPSNEFDTYITKSDLGGLITSGDDSIWNGSTVGSWCKETPINTIKENTYRIRRNLPNVFATQLSDTESTNMGFRPVLQLKHPKQKTLWE